MTGSWARTVAVVGGGQMGAGIAHAFVVLGATVTVVEPDSDTAGRAEQRIATDVSRTCAKRGLDEDEAAAQLARLRIVDQLALIPADSDLVVEAVPELVELKTAVLGAIEQAVPATAVLASNTSSLSVTELASRLARPGRFLGMHFFNPVPASALVELVTGARTDPGVVDQVRELVAALGKESIVVDDSPGFATSRLGLALGLEAIRMYEAGVASARDLDRAMVLGYRHPVGPLELTDLVGLDVRLAVAEHLQGELGERFAPPELLRRLVAEGKLGKKTGEGFHVWDS
ncbi:3-hydroxyacyl-CoA dehydrogenase family protein [Nocardioides humi]|uniref:3-hydroxyacyl-CoA dehydrogenase family protein n=1 Tax=Nocardioides humi TaxID=449461 RepID=A0ABN2AE54_9ACTN|nr:3-hydroxyacyl-CoA dehydrogenase family protein [Nocardioides humi]